MGDRQAFDHSTPCGPHKSASEIGHPAKGRIVLKVNGKVRQDGDLNQMIWNVPEIIAKLSEMVELTPGDFIMTGTPSSVAATVAGDKIECEVEDVSKLALTIGSPLKNTSVIANEAKQSSSAMASGPLGRFALRKEDDSITGSALFRRHRFSTRHMAQG